MNALWHWLILAVVLVAVWAWFKYVMLPFWRWVRRTITGRKHTQSLPGLYRSSD